MLILSPEKESKIGSKEPENQQNLRFERGLLHKNLNGSSILIPNIKNNVRIMDAAVAKLYNLLVHVPKGERMRTLSCYLFFAIINMANLEAYMMHQKSPILQEWKEENLSPFDELMISWNASRPSEGKFLFYVSVKTDQWSPWMLYASWGSKGQSSFLTTTEEAPVRSYQDAIEIMEGKKANAFQVKIVAEGGSNLSSIHGIHVYTNSDKYKEVQNPNLSLASMYLDVPGLSQMALNHVRYADLCSPTSTTAVTRYLSNDYAIDPLLFAQQAWDSGFDIFGNWVFNVAEASTYLGNSWDCWVERLHGFNDIHTYISQGTPVIVSIRGPLPGSAQPYAKGHLLAVIGYDSLNQKVICMDPAFSIDSETHVFYDLADFIQAWNRRGNAAYIFKKNQ